MKQEIHQQPLNLITTVWSLVCRAHQGTGDEVNAARAQLLERYGGAVQRYLHKLLPQPDAADDVFQEFALQLVRGKLRGADPQHGQFRQFIKGTLFHLVADHRQQQQRWPQPLPADGALVAAPAAEECDQLFVESWRDELLARAWESLRHFETTSDQPHFTVLRFRSDHQDLHSPELAARLAESLHRPLTAVAVRQLLHRAREKFAEFLLEQVTHSLANATAAQLEQELIAVGLLDYCRPALARFVSTRLAV
jgi:RNA polymerase sigma-70 factor (ECF subfamily)